MLVRFSRETGLVDTYSQSRTVLFLFALRYVRRNQDVHSFPFKQLFVARNVRTLSYEGSESRTSFVRKRCRRLRQPGYYFAHNSSMDPFLLRIDDIAVTSRRTGSKLHDDCLDCRTLFVPLGCGGETDVASQRVLVQLNANLLGP